MNQEDIIRMAREAGIDFDLIDEDEGQIWYITAQGLKRFADLIAARVAAAEREACAQVCDDRDMGDCNREDMEARACAAAIRARGQA